MSESYTSMSPAVLARDRAVLARWSTSMTTGELLRAAFFIGAVQPLSMAFITLVVPRSGDDLTVEGDPTMRILLTVIYAVGALLLVGVWKRMRPVLSSFVPVALLVAMAMVSPLWSEVPDLTLRRSIGLLGTTLLGVCFALRYNAKQQIRILSWALLIAGGVSLLGGLVFPEYRISESDLTAWRGVFTHKNTLGAMMSLGVVLSAVRAMTMREERRAAVVLMALCGVLLYLSESRTAQLVTIPTLMLLVLFRYVRDWKRLLRAAVIVGIPLVLIALWIISNAEKLLLAMGKDVTFTGRLPLWLMVLQFIPKHPWLGYGFSAFWLGHEGNSGVVLTLLGGPAPHAHNGLLQLILDLGFVGLAIFLFHFGVHWVRASRSVRQGLTADNLWPLMFLTFLFLYNITEGALVVQNHIFWFLYVAATVALDRAIKSKESA